MAVIVSLEPDLIAEHHVASVSDKELIDGCLQMGGERAAGRCGNGAVAMC